MPLSSSSACAELASSSTPLMPAPFFDSGAENMSPRPVAPAPTSTSLSRNSSGGIAPLSTSIADTVRKVPIGPANGMPNR